VAKGKWVTNALIAMKCLDSKEIVYPNALDKLEE